MPVPLWLDHASVTVPDLPAAIGHLERRLGLPATVSPAAPERHSRVYLDRSYLEVAVGPTPDGRWDATMFFLRFDDPDAVRAHLDDVGIGYRWGEYEGVDGIWDDVEVDVIAPSLSTLIRRTAPADVADDWPPALQAPHRCGASTLAAVHIEVPSVDETARRYGRLLGTGSPSPARPPHVALTSGELVLHEGGSDAIVGIVLGVASLDGTRAELGDVLEVGDDGTAWLDPSAAFGVRLGFAETA